MPEISGLEVQEWLQASGHPLPAIFLTAQNSLPQQVRTRLDRAAGFLSKPVSAKELLKAIEEAPKIRAHSW